MADSPACSDNRMKTPWTDSVERSCPLPEYPRPQMARDPWLCLNGLWDYAFRISGSIPDHYDGKIVVPFSPETELSGVRRALKKDEILWYHREVELPESFDNKRVLLHFDAVDQEAAVWVNGIHVAGHEGGYLPFETDITDALLPGRRAEIIVCVRDETDAGERSRGKQKTRRGGIWYTPQSGIWQTVWMEAVPENHIRALSIKPDYDRAIVSITAELSGDAPAYVRFRDKEYPVPALLEVESFEPWSPENPKLYEFTVHCGTDEVRSYFAMRKFSVEPDAAGVPRLFLNNAPYFQNGLLDQGYWPDGLYTPPCDEAMIFDIRTAREMGFNMLRKHIKVEPLRWYYHCDRLGMLVWQDMPCGGGMYNPVVVTAPLFTGLHLKDHHYRLFARSNEKCRASYRAELADMVRHLYNCPCICMWVPFNEGWGQFDAAEMAELVQNLDGTRPVDHASGWHDQGVGKVRSFHVYFTPYRYRPDPKGRAVLLSEFGGYVLAVDGHRFSNRVFGYKRLETPEKLAEALTRLYRREIMPAKEQGLSAAVYTQISDVEDELNGLITYDRKVIKINPKQVNSIINPHDQSNCK